MKPSFGLMQMPRERETFEGKPLKPRMTPEDTQEFIHYLSKITAGIPRHLPAGMIEAGTVEARPEKYIAPAKVPADTTTVVSGVVYRKCPLCSRTYQESHGGRVTVRYVGKIKSCDKCYQKWLGLHGKPLDI